jgi:hypothetical protein
MAKHTINAALANSSGKIVSRRVYSVTAKCKRIALTRIAKTSMCAMWTWVPFTEKKINKQKALQHGE